MANKINPNQQIQVLEKRLRWYLENPEKCPTSVYSHKKCSNHNCAECILKWLMPKGRKNANKRTMA